jgi:hypothetical protein
MGYPVDDLTKPADLAGCTNGKLPDSVMVTPGYRDTSSDGRSSGRMHHLAARAFAAFDAAVSDRFGELLTCTSSADCYRTYDQQYNCFMDRYTTDYISGASTKSCMGDTWYLIPGNAGAACPGTSNHGWALARDTCLWRNGGIVSITANDDAFDWMLDNADLYGLSWESQSEPWHIRYNTAEDIPDAVLDFEAGGGGTDEPPPPDTFEVTAVRYSIWQGATGPMVQRAQLALNIAGAGLAVDGQFGPRTDDATRDFQTARGLEVDGRIGPQTWGALEV